MVKFSAKLEYIFSAMKGSNFRTVWGIAWYWNEKPTISEPVGYQTKLTQSSIFCPAPGWNINKHPKAYACVSFLNTGDQLCYWIRKIDSKNQCSPLNDILTVSIKEKVSEYRTNKFRDDVLLDQRCCRCILELDVFCLQYLRLELLNSMWFTLPQLLQYFNIASNGQKNQARSTTTTSFFLSNNILSLNICIGLRQSIAIWLSKSIGQKKTNRLQLIVIVRYHSGGSMELNARILLLAYMVYL